MTKQRQLISDIIKTSCKHLSAEEIYERTRVAGSKMALGTVYRNLGLMCADGTIMKISVCGEPDRYDRNACLHGHLKCKECGSIFDIPLSDTEELEKLLENMAEKTRSNVLSYDFIVNCICSECTEKSPHKI